MRISTDSNQGPASSGALPNYRQLVDAIQGYAVVHLDDTGVVTNWPPGAEQLTQYTASEMVGRPISVLSPEPDIAGGGRQEGLHAAEESGCHLTEDWRVRKDGSQYWASVTLNPIRDEGGATVGFVEVSCDRSRQRNQALQQRDVEQMLNSITDFEVIRLDSAGVVQSWSRSAQAIKGYSQQEVLGHHVSMFYTEEDARAGLAEREMAAALRDGRMETEGWRVRKDGSRFWAGVVLAPIRDEADQVVGFVKVARDLTERRDAEQLLQRQRDEILELSTPVIQVWDRVLVLPIIGTLDSYRAARLTENLLERIARDQAEVVILDISGAPTIDTDVAQHLLKTVEATRLMGTASILSGVRPETAQAIVHLGIELGNLRSRNNLKEALQLALRIVGATSISERSAGNA